MKSGYLVGAFVTLVLSIAVYLHVYKHNFAAFLTVVILALIAVAGVLFLGREHLLKYRFLGQFADGCKAMVIYHFP